VSDMVSKWSISVQNSHFWVQFDWKIQLLWYTEISTKTPSLKSIDRSLIVWDCLFCIIWTWNRCTQRWLVGYSAHDKVWKSQFKITTWKPHHKRWSNLPKVSQLVSQLVSSDLERKFLCSRSDTKPFNVLKIRSVWLLGNIYWKSFNIHPFS